MWPLRRINAIDRYKAAVNNQMLLSDSRLLFARSQTLILVRHVSKVITGANFSCFIFCSVFVGPVTTHHCLYMSIIFVSYKLLTCEKASTICGHKYDGGVSLFGGDVFMIHCDFSELWCK